MSEKIPFDPKKHLLKPSKTQVASNSAQLSEIDTNDDEAYARFVQEELMEEDRLREHQSSMPHESGISPDAAPYRLNTPVPDTAGDLELLLELQKQELEVLRDDRRINDLELARRMQHEEALVQMHSEYKDQLTYARKLQERAFRDRLAPDFIAPYDALGIDPNLILDDVRVVQPESDLDIALRMQQLEEMGMGRINSDRSLTHNRQTETSASSAWSQQEEQDARIARMIAESGQSFRDLMPQPPLSTNLPSEFPDPPVVEVKEPRIPSDIDQRRTSKPKSPTPVLGMPILSEQDPFRAPAHTLGRSRSPKNTRRLRRSTSPKQGPSPSSDPVLHDVTSESVMNKAAKKNFAGLFRKSSKDKAAPNVAVPAPIPQKPAGLARLGNPRTLPITDDGGARIKHVTVGRKRENLCSNCQKPAHTFLVALDKRFHPQCLKCVGCYLVIDANKPFAFMTDERGEKHPLHRHCYAELYGVKCAVCRKSIPVGSDGKVNFVKHPFFDKEQMCPEHVKNPGRRCTGCHRFEPEGLPFADLNDHGRCVCYSCCRSVIVDSTDAQPLWDSVIYFFEHILNLPIWSDLRNVPVLIVGYEALNAQMLATGATHGGSSQIMTRGLCLTEHQRGRKFKLSKLKYDKSNSSFVSGDEESRGYTFFQVPDAEKSNPHSSVTAILCLSGLPRDLAASVLAHEATHAWVKLHPRFDISYPIPPQVEEGCAQLISMLYLTEGLAPASSETYGDSGPSDEKLRQYFKFSIETDDNEIYGQGFRKAAAAYANIGIEALLSHIVLYQNFPET